jgi:dTDP-4-dehydrorhamnose 3,5-epimerase-like enzyme
VSLDLCKIISLPSFNDKRGSLSFLEGANHIPFEIRRIYYIYDVPKNVVRGNHAHKELEQLIISISGSFDINLDDGNSIKKFHLSKRNEGLYICPKIWRTIENFEEGSTCLVLASEEYKTDDYIFNYKEFTI